MPAMLDVVIVGGGPVGTFLGCLLTAAGLKVRVLEARAELDGHSRAIGIHPPALQAFARIGLADRIIAAGTRIDTGVLRSRGSTVGTLSLATASPKFPFVLALPQNATQRLLEDRLHRLAPAAMQRGRTVTGIRRIDAGWEVAVAGDGQSLSARCVIGADGARSRMRGWLGIAARPQDYPDTYLMGDFADSAGAADRTSAIIHLEPGGVVESFPLPGGIRRWVVRTPSLQQTARPYDLAELIRIRTGEAVAAETSTMISAFAVRRAVAERMVAEQKSPGNGCAMLIGDAAHELSPIGGQGMNLGWLDAAALAPMLVDLLRGVGDRRIREDELPDFERTRLRSARIAARRAELNMALGRRTPPVLVGIRDAGFRLALRSPAREALVGAFTMRGL
ncbi:NAD(P)/FAD-dependent oxidoreductase [Saxibacter everestensis]|uniref:NAD(P)/FAD-dependent oxidoreductase n=1 Tax=Saxibacter everestensis TaxID=2909229 RepID=A0ABY8QS66_9MICO|nr:NAD(P)/FAD-dependent oxidoreductase [Brevibacteriaceae bacterium ZFBP1038]